MTDSIFHGLAIGLSLLASCPPGQRVVDDGLRPLDGLPRPRRLGQREHAADPGRAPPDCCSQDMELIDGDHRAHADRRAGRAASSRCRSTCRCSTSPPSSTRAAPTPSARPPSANGRGSRRRRRPVPERAAGAAEPEDEPDEDNGYHTVGLSAVEDPTRPPVVPRAEAPAFAGRPAAAGGIGRRPRRFDVPVEAPGFAIESAADALSSTPPPSGPQVPPPVAPDERAASVCRRRPWRPWQSPGEPGSSAPPPAPACEPVAPVEPPARSRVERAAGGGAASSRRPGPGRARRRPAVAERAGAPAIVFDKTVVTPGRTPPFVDAGAIRAAAESAGLRLPGRRLRERRRARSRPASTCC